MASNNKRTRGATRSRNGQAAPAWVFFAAGFISGGFLVFLFFLGGNPQHSKGEQPVQQAAKPKPAKPESQPQTQFDFFTLLPEREVIVPDQTKEEQAQERNEEPYHYILQTGSFRSAKDADRLRAELILLALDAKVEAVEANGDTWHRVYVGPFTSRSKLASARQTLVSKGIDTLLLKRKLDQ